MPGEKSSELFPVVDLSGNVIGKATRGECHDSRSMLLHPVVHLHVFTPGRGALLLQKRSAAKMIQPGKWDTAVGGHVDYGESVAEALLRETREELGVDASAATAVGRYVWESSVERELVNIFEMVADPDTFRSDFDPEEVEEVRFWPVEEIKAAFGKEILTPNLEKELQRVYPEIFNL